jgi:hypothetical protein
MLYDGSMASEKLTLGVLNTWVRLFPTT